MRLTANRVTLRAMQDAVRHIIEITLVGAAVVAAFILVYGIGLMLLS